jgi:FkbM family methyltransferase
MDCLLETRQWETKHQKQIYLEIGAHIGVCALELLLNTQAQVVLVEAHKYNIFSLTSTFKQNPKFLDRVTVVPLALGNEPTANADMELLKVEDYASAAINPSSLGNIVMERLDNILNPGGIQQVSLHINGYECNVMDGAVKVLKKVSRITYTVAPTLMEKHGCSKELLLAKFQALGKEPKWYRDTGRLRPISINIKGGFKGVAIQVK